MRDKEKWGKYHMKRILVCCDTFKGTLSSTLVCEAVASSLSQHALVRCAPMSDGGAGLLDALLMALPDSRIIRCPNIQGPLLGQVVEGRYLRFQDCAVVEMASAAGLPLIPQDVRKDPRTTTSFGVGQLLQKVADDEDSQECTRLFIGIGGSATNDGGIGALQALGLNCYTKDNLLTKKCTGGDLMHISRLEMSTQLQQFKRRFQQILLLCDATNPFVGEHGATRIYGPQKGATTEEILQQLEDGMVNIAVRIEEATDVSIAHMKGAGGAGGMSGSFLAVLGSQWSSGADTVGHLVQLPYLLNDCDIVISGEGSYDAQTILFGKSVRVIQEMARRAGKKFVVVCGVSSGVHEGQQVISLVPRFTPEVAMKDTALCISTVVQENLHRLLGET